MKRDSRRTVSVTNRRARDTPLETSGRASEPKDVSANRATEREVTKREEVTLEIATIEMWTPRDIGSR